MRLLVTGGRDYADAARVAEVLDDLHRRHWIALLVHGACGWDMCKPETFAGPINGADGLADRWAVLNLVPVVRVPARWTRDGNGGGPIRNAFMVRHYEPDLAIAFPGGRGTWGCAELARKRGVPVEVIR